MAGPVLTHRLILRPESRLRKLTPAAVVAEVVADVAVPMLSNEPPVQDGWGAYQTVGQASDA